MSFDENTKIWSGPIKAPLFNPHISLGAILLEMLRQNPNKIGQISANNGYELSNRELRLLAIQAALQIRKLGLQKDDVICLACNNHECLAPIVIALLSIGTPLNGLFSKFTAGEMSHMFNITTPKLVFCDDDNVVTVLEALKLSNLDVPLFNFGQTIHGVRNVNELFKPTGTEDMFIPIDIKDGTKQIAAIVCSSGTTGTPKAVSLSHAALVDHNFKTLTPLTSDDVIFCYSSIYWITGISALIKGTLFGSTRIITTDPFTADSCLQIIQKYTVTTFFSSPSQLALLLQSNLDQSVYLSSIRSINTGGTFISSRVINGINSVLLNGNTCLVYGISEGAGAVACNELNCNKIDSVGKLVACTQAKIIADNGTLCSSGENGEIWLKTQYPFLGYYRNEDATNNTVYENGWICTGDIGHFDKNGFLHLTGRKKDVMKWMSYQISPSEIEDVILQHKGVANVCVVPIPDSIGTDLPAALIIKNNKCDVTKEEIINLVKVSLSFQKQIRGGVYFVESFPMTPSGKILRKNVIEIAVELCNAEKV